MCEHLIITLWSPICSKSVRLVGTILSHEMRMRGMENMSGRKPSGEYSHLGEAVVFGALGPSGRGNHFLRRSEMGRLSFPGVVFEPTVHK